VTGIWRGRLGGTPGHANSALSPSLLAASIGSLTTMSCVGLVGARPHVNELYGRLTYNS
jgi:hypothetical protein